MKTTTTKTTTTTKSTTCMGSIGRYYNISLYFTTLMGCIYTYCFENTSSHKNRL